MENKDSENKSLLRDDLSFSSFNLPKVGELNDPAGLFNLNRCKSSFALK